MAESLYAVDLTERIALMIAVSAGESSYLLLFGLNTISFFFSM
jgi:hypothetical protein